MKNEKTKLSGADLLAIGYQEGKVIGLLLEMHDELLEHNDKELYLNQLKEVLASPIQFLEDEKYGIVAEELLRPVDKYIKLRDEPGEYRIYGKDGIESGALRQIETAMKLPVAKSGALMPDAHQGYGLPIGGVLATENAVIPYAVGVDIGCRMSLSIYDISDSIFNNSDQLKKILTRNTKFGRASFRRPKEHEVLDSPLFNEIKIIKDLKDKAAAQIGSSGGGNHFVEFGITEILSSDNDLNIPSGKYLALLSHSGSRGFGGTIAKHYTKLAMEQCKLPHEAEHLAWMDLDTEEGMEYWLAMNLAGDYASACHQQIHERIAIGLGTMPIASVENHHNFAWKEKDIDGNEVIVHRKGATPAGHGVMGIIPGTMTTPGFIVRGKGCSESINSASHGAGRAMSRTQAKNTLDQEVVTKFIEDAGVEVIGSGIDEAPMAYKDIHSVMAAQQDLVEVVGSFQPRIVRMCGDHNFLESN